MSFTAYVILRHRDAAAHDGSRWQLLEGGDGRYPSAATFEARSAEAAIRQVVEKSGEEGLYVAIPERSWLPREMRVETTKRVIVVGAGEGTG